MNPLVKDTGRVQIETQASASRRALVFERGKFWALELDDQAATPPTLPHLPVVLSEVTVEAVEELARAMDLPNSEVVLQRFSSRRRCFVARLQNQLAAYCWVSQSSQCIGELEHEIKIPPGEAYIWDCATLPAFRQKHIYSALLSYLTSDLREEGLQRVWIGSSLSNRPSLRAFARAGFRPVATVLYLRLFDLSFLALFKDPYAAGSHQAALRRMLASGQERALGPFFLGFTRLIQLQACVGKGD